MAGGSGTRFWPASRRERPKQFLTLFGDRSLIQLAWERSRAIADSSRCWVVTGASHADLVREQLPDLPPENLLVEPCPRNTAPCIGLAAVRLRQRDPDAVMAVLPSDQLITPAGEFAATVRSAADVIGQRPEAIVLFGIRPTYPATGFGYIESGEPLADRSDVRSVSRFREKPNFETAKAFLESGRFLWNSGIFVWRAARILDALARHEPDLAAGLKQIESAPDWDLAVSEYFSTLRSISIDYAVLEREASTCLVQEGAFEWDDVGSWEAVARRSAPDNDGHVVRGLHRGIDSRHLIVQSTADHLVATIGVEDLVIVHTTDATLVARRNDEDGMKRLIELLKSSGLDGSL